MRICFVPQGTVARSSEIDGKTLFLDVGNALREGVIDHHHLGGSQEDMGEPCRATSRLTAAFSHLIPAGVETIVLHRGTDFDCWLSVWLVLRRLSGLPFPFGTSLLTNFAALNDQGLASFRTAHALAPVACLLADTVGIPLGPWSAGRPVEQFSAAILEGEQEKEGMPPATPELVFDEVDAKDRALLLRGMALITYLFERISRLQNKLGPAAEGTSLTLDMPDLFDFAQDWPTESSMAQADLSQYRRERDDTACCEITRVSLPVRDGGAKQPAEALLWKRVPSCRLHKFWARSDQERVSDGFALTAIPLFEEEHNGVPVSRVIISTDPAKSYDLRHLGPVLERAEVARERWLCEGTADPAYQTRSAEMLENGRMPRFRESWCTNHDPWYDGRAHAHTIVDAPGRGSLLSIGEVLEIVKGHLRLDLAGARVRVVHPFTWSNRPGSIGLSGMLKKLDHHPRLERFRLDETFSDVRNDFLGPVFDLFVPDGQSLSIHAWHLDRFLWSETENTESGWLTVEVDLLLLRNGCGFLVTHGECPAMAPDGTGSAMTALLAEQKRRCERIESIETLLYPLLGTVQASTGYVHAAVRARSVQADRRDLEGLCYKVAHRLDYRRDEESLHSDEDAQILSRNGRLLRLIPVQQHILFGFSQRGACLCLLDDGRDTAKRDFYEARFAGAHFAAFLIGLVQRTTLLSLSARLGGLLRGRSRERSALLIKQMHVECVTKAMYGQIATHALLGQAYLHQSDMFQIKGMAAEVETQAGVYDAFLREERNRKIKVITALYLPMQILDWLVGLKLVGLPDEAVLPLSVGSTLGGIALLSAVLYAYILREPRYR